MCGTYSSHRESRNAYKILVGKPEGQKLFGRPRRRLKDVPDVKMDWNDTRSEDVN
jgi:hypothetical protein